MNTRHSWRKRQKSYVDKIFAELKAHGYNPNLMKLYIMGGGAKVVELVGIMTVIMSLSTTIYGQTPRDMNISAI